MKQELPRYIGKGLQYWLDELRHQPVPEEWFGLLSRLEYAADCESSIVENKPNPTSKDSKQHG